MSLHQAPFPSVHAEEPGPETPGQGKALEILRRVFGFPAYRDQQQPVVEHMMAGGDALVLLPTGAGKSVCYQLPALARSGMGLVVSPLIALMEDQVAALRQLGVRAAALHSELDPAEAAQLHRAIDTGDLDLLYVSPERLLAGTLLNRLAHLKLALIAIDEAHCVSQWGHEFRPDYRNLACLGERLPGIPRIALTATADPRTRTDILAALGLQGAKIFTASFHRPNLEIAVQPKIGETAQVTAFLAARPGQTGIVYCGSRARTDRLAERLRARGHHAIAYHAGLGTTDKRAALRSFRAGDAMVMVATIAFGMGIDRPDVRFVAHVDMPDSPEAYYQQIGRAGRDGLPSHTLLLHGGEDIARARHFLSMSAAPEHQRAAMRARLEAMVAYTETVDCRTAALLACFGETLPAPCGHCDNCRTPPTLQDGTEAARLILSAAFRTGQMFGANHLIAVVRGEATDLVRRHHHDQLPLFGKGKDHAVPFWRAIIRQLLVRGAMDIKEGDFASLMLVPEAARPLLRGESTMRVRQHHEAATPRPPRTRAPPPPPPGAPPATPASASRFTALREWRAREAKTQNVPAYVIFHDSTLLEIATRHPATRDDLATIKGVGASKLERYADTLLAALRATGVSAG